MKTKLSKKTIILRALVLLLILSLAATSAVLGYTLHWKNYIEEQRIYYPTTLSYSSIVSIEARVAEGADITNIERRILEGEYIPYLPDVCSLIVAGEYITDRSELTEDDLLVGRYNLDPNGAAYNSFAAAAERYDRDIDDYLGLIKTKYYAVEFLVEDVLRGDAVEPGDIIKIQLTPGFIMPVGTARDRAVLLLDEDGSNVYPGAYHASEGFSYWLTDDNIVLSKQAGVPSQEKYSEMSLERFKTEINRELDATIERKAQVEASRAASSAAITAD